MSEWDQLAPEEQARRRAARRRVHGSVAGEMRLALEDARADLLAGVVAWLRARGHAAAADDLDAEWWEIPGSPERSGLAAEGREERSVGQE